MYIYIYKLLGEIHFSNTANTLTRISLKSKIVQTSPNAPPLV